MRSAAGSLWQADGKVKMRLDKFLKLSRVIKRRTVANDVCQAGRVNVNGRPAKAGTKLKIGDVVTVLFGGGAVSFKVMALPESPKRDEASSMYELIEDTAGETQE